MACVVTLLFIPHLILFHPQTGVLSATLEISHRISSGRSGLIILSDEFIITKPQVHATRGRCWLIIFQRKSRKKGKRKSSLSRIFLYLHHDTVRSHFIIRECSGCARQRDRCCQHRDSFAALASAFCHGHVGCRGLWLSQAVALLRAS